MINFDVYVDFIMIINLLENMIKKKILNDYYDIF